MLKIEQRENRKENRKKEKKEKRLSPLFAILTLELIGITIVTNKVVSSLDL